MGWTNAHENATMIDTVKLASPYISEESAGRIEQACFRQSKTEIATGLIEYELVTGSLAGSWDSKVSVRVEREEFVVGSVGLRGITESVVTGKKVRPSVTKLPCAPYLVIEGSVHKALLGHNVFGGPLEPVLSCCWFIQDLSERLDVTLPDADDWTVERIDWAEAYELPSFEACQEYVSGLNMAQFPRRAVIRYGSESLMAPGRTTAVKVYHKGPEFSAHDRRRLRESMDVFELIGLQERANCILRFETSIKARKLSDDNKGKKPLVVQVTRDYLETVHDREAARLLKEAKTDMETVRTHRDVASRLRGVYEARLADTLFGTWMQLAALGEEEARKHLPRSTWYWRKAKLVGAGCTWLAADVHVSPSHSSIPAGFSPVRRDPRRLLEEAPQVSDRLQSFNRPYPKIYA